MKVRLRLPTDLDSCVVALRQVHEVDGYPDPWPNEPVEFLDPAGTVRAWVAEVDGRIGGHLLVADGPKPAESDAVSTGAGAGARVVKVSRLFVTPSAQGRGVARELLVQALSWAEQHDLDVHLEVVAGTPAVRVYERLGWQFLSAGPARWVGRDGVHPTVRLYTAPSTSFAGQ